MRTKRGPTPDSTFSRQGRLKSRQARTFKVVQTGRTNMARVCPRPQDQLLRPYVVIRADQTRESIRWAETWRLPYLRGRNQIVERRQMHKSIIEPPATRQRQENSPPDFHTPRF